MSTDTTPTSIEAPARWYMVNAVGVATLCADRQDAEQAAADAQAAWPHAGPHRAVQMLEAAAAPTHRAVKAGDAGAQGDALDAERYRWLRDRSRIFRQDPDMSGNHYWMMRQVLLRGPTLDAAIDAARAQDKEPTHDN